MSLYRQKRHKHVTPGASVAIYQAEDSSYLFSFRGLHEVPICSSLWSQHCSNPRWKLRNSEAVQQLGWRFLKRNSDSAKVLASINELSGGKQYAMITLRSIYNAWETPYAKRFLIERNWSREPDRPSLHLEGWLKDVAPSYELSKWFASDRKKWQEFRRRYFDELDSHPEVWKFLAEEARSCTVELLYNSHDPKHNNAVALKEYLESKLAAAAQPMQSALSWAGNAGREQINEHRASKL
jgi:uncharacterized protein YeaO (DUF488 family)